MLSSKWMISGGLYALNGNWHNVGLSSSKKKYLVDTWMSILASFIWIHSLFKDSNIKVHEINLCAWWYKTIWIPNKCSQIELGCFRSLRHNIWAGVGNWINASLKILLAFSMCTNINLTCCINHKGSINFNCLYKCTSVVQNKNNSWSCNTAMGIGYRIHNHARACICYSSITSCRAIFGRGRNVEEVRGWGIKEMPIIWINRNDSKRGCTIIVC